MRQELELHQSNQPVENSIKSILITGGAGYIGSVLTGFLLNKGYHVTVVDNLSFGGDSLLGYWRFPNFRFVKGDIGDPQLFNIVNQQLQVGDLAPQAYFAIVHLAAIVGFPASRIAGDDEVKRINIDATERLFDIANRCGIDRFVMASTYSNYGTSADGSHVTEESPLFPQSLYAETKISSEEYLLNDQHRGQCAPVILRFATLFGLSPRMRFDLMINQFVLQALTEGHIKIYQPDYTRSFIHVADVVNCINEALTAPRASVDGQIFNVGDESGNFTKRRLAQLLQEVIPGLSVEYVEVQFSEDMQDISVSFEKVQKVLGFKSTISIRDGIVELKNAIQWNVISTPSDTRYRNAPMIFQ